jgi:hypothetical protein
LSSSTHAILRWCAMSEANLTPSRGGAPTAPRNIEEAYTTAWHQRAWDSAQHATPMGIVFATTAQWRRWRQRLHERYGDLDLLTISGCAGAIFVAFQQRSGQWLPATVIDTLVDLAHQDWERPESRGPPACHRGVGLTSTYGRPDRRQKGRPGCTSIPLRTVRDRKDETRLHDEQPMPYDADARRVGEAPSSCWHSGQTVPVPPAEADDARDAATRAALEVLRERARYWAERAVGASRNGPK